MNSPAQGEPPDSTKTIPGNKPGETTERTYGPMGAPSKMSTLATIMGLAIHTRTIGTGVRLDQEDPDAR